MSEIILNPWLPPHHKKAAIIKALPSSAKTDDTAFLADFIIASAVAHNATIHVCDGYLFLVNQYGGNIMYSAWTKNGDLPASITIGYCASGTFFEHIAVIKPILGFTLAASQEIGKLCQHAVSPNKTKNVLPEQYVLPINEYVEKLRHNMAVRDMEQTPVVSTSFTSSGSLGPVSKFSNSNITYHSSTGSMPLTNPFGTQMTPNSPYMPTYTTNSLTVTDPKKPLTTFTFHKFLSTLPAGSITIEQSHNWSNVVIVNGKQKFKKEGWYVHISNDEIRAIRRNSMGLIENLEGSAVLTWNRDGTELLGERWCIAGNDFTKKDWESKANEQKQHRVKFVESMFKTFIKVNEKCRELYVKAALSGNALTEDEAFVIDRELKDNTDFVSKMVYLDQAILAGLPADEKLFDDKLFRSWASTNFDFFLSLSEGKALEDKAITYFDPELFGYDPRTYCGPTEPTSLMDDNPIFGYKAYQAEQKAKQEQKQETQKVKEEEKKMDLQIDFKADLRESLKRGSIRRVRKALAEVVANLLVSDLASNKKKSAKNTVLEILKTPHGEAIFSVMLGTATPVLAAQFPEEYAKYIFEVAREFRVSGGGDLVYEVTGMLEAVAGNAFSEVKDALSQLKEFDETQGVKRRVELGDSLAAQSSKEEQVLEASQHRDTGTAKNSK